MIAISTAWNASRLGNLPEAVRELRELGHEAVELFLSGAAGDGEAGGRVCRELGVRCRTVRAPAASERDGLSSLDDGVRAEALRAALGALPAAAAAGAEVVVLSLGEIGSDGDDPSPEVREQHLSRAARSLFSLTRAEPGVTWAFRTPAGARGLPSLPEVELLLEDAGGRRVGYVHDSGRGRLLERAGICDQLAWLDRHGAGTVGLLLSDVVGDLAGLPPGTGEVDWAALAGAAGAGMHRTLRLDPRHSAAELRLGIDHLESCGF